MASTSHQKNQALHGTNMMSTGKRSGAKSLSISMAIKERTSSGWTYKCLIALLLISSLCLVGGCLLFNQDHVDITSECVDSSNDVDYGFILTADYCVIAMDESQKWKQMVLAKYVGKTPPCDEPDAHMFSVDDVNITVIAGTKFKIIKVVKDLDNWGRPGEGFHLCTMTIELDTPDKFRCEMPADSFEIRPFRFYPDYAKPIKKK